MKFFRHLKAVMRFMQLPKSQRRLTFYCEGKNYWPHFEGLIKQILATADVPICYISSDDNDPGLCLKHKNFQTFKINEGFIRNYLFENLETEVMVMTMPDLQQYQVKRSKHKVHYIYLQHSLVSLHMIYRKGAFDYYDTIFCAGPHHLQEVLATEEKYNLPKKNLVKHGYARLDSIVAEAKKHHKTTENNPKHVLIAPSWGQDCIIESGLAENIVDKLLTAGFQVTLRPHPQTIKFANDRILKILKKHNQNKLFTFEANVAGQESLHASDVMICDWSGAALDYAFGLNKPVLFVDVAKKINNQDYQEINIEPFEISIREKIGAIMPVDGDVVEAIANMKPLNMTENYYYKNADLRGAQEILKVLNNKDKPQ